MATKLTDAGVEKLPFAKPGKRYEVRDPSVAGLVVRVSHTNRSFMFYAKLPGGRNFVRRAIGRADQISVKKAREIARSWHGLIEDKGVDPRDDRRRKAEEEAGRRHTETRKRADTFAAVAEGFIKAHLANKRHARKDEAQIRRWVIPEWGDRPISDIKRRDVVALIEKIAATGKRRTAQIAFGHVRKLFNWAVKRDAYGLENSPCFGMRAEDHAGKKKDRKHTLSDEELVALWRACDKLQEQGNPHGALTKFILLTGCRRDEPGGASWSEFSNLDDPSRAVFTVLEARHKQGEEHHVPLSPCCGRSVTINSASRQERQARHFRVQHHARRAAHRRLFQGQEDARCADDGCAGGAAAPAGVLHDLRRTFRTKLARLKVPYEVAESAIGHAPPGRLDPTYIQHSYEGEICEAMNLWADHRMDLLRPKPDGTVVTLKRKRA